MNQDEELERKIQELIRRLNFKFGNNGGYEFFITSTPTPRPLNEPLEQSGSPVEREILARYLKETMERLKILEEDFSNFKKAILGIGKEKIKKLTKEEK